MSKKASLSPNLVKNIHPPFHQMPWEDFEKLCHDIMEFEDNVNEVRAFGVKGEKQNGIDIKGYRNDGFTSVGQCKCYEKFGPLEIREASKEFLKHEKDWKKDQVDHFILMTACAMNHIPRVKEIEEQKKLFSKKKIRYEVWDANDIKKKLEKHPEIIRRYFAMSDYWIEYICGIKATNIQSNIPPSTLNMLNHLATEKIETLINQVFDSELNEARTSWKLGCISKSKELLIKIKSSNDWECASDTIKAKILRFEASIELHSKQNILLAISLVEEAKKLSPLDDYSRIQALILYYQNEIETAIELLKEKNDIDDLNLLAVFYLEKSNLKDAYDTLFLTIKENQCDSETYRLRALYYLLSKNITKSYINIEKALLLDSSSRLIKLTKGIIEFNFIIHEPFLPESLMPWPFPLLKYQIKSDKNSLNHLKKAIDIFKELIEQEDIFDDKKRYEIWLLACLANKPDKDNEAGDYCKKILRIDPLNLAAIFWAVHNNWDMDLQPSKDEVIKLIDSKMVTENDIILLIQILIFENKSKQAIQLLIDNKEVFISQENIYLYWLTQLKIFDGFPEEALQLIESINEGCNIPR